jgi:DNA polymerase I-like protein with 3'-5' exonuclease and polymerase domains
MWVFLSVGGVLLAADYSQLELRMIAHLSQDSKLIQILNGDGDVFKLITAQWKSISVGEVTPEQRQQAKQVRRGRRSNQIYRTKGGRPNRWERSEVKLDL